MAEYTKNYNFKKPDKTDYFNINDQNENWDLLDETLKNSKTRITKFYQQTATYDNR